MKLKLHFIPDGRQGKSSAQVFYVKKEDAGKAVQKLYYERELGDSVKVDFYKLKEARIQE